MSQLGQRPERAQNARFLQQDTVVGQKVDFVNQSVYATAGMITLQATGDGSLQDFGYFQINLILTRDDNVLPWESTLAFPYVNFYIDDGGAGAPDDNKLWRLGADATSTRGQQSIDIIPMPFYPDVSSFADGYSNTNYYYCRNYDSSSHTIRAVTFWKYIVTGELVT